VNISVDKKGGVIMFGVIALIAIICLLIPAFIKALSKGNYNKAAERTTLPPQLGIRDNLHLDKLVHSLDEAISDDFKVKIKRRYLAEHPKANEAYFEACFFELKRFFLMCSLLNNVPMFSKKVDMIWHEMIMYTKEYEKFSNDFCKEPIHHSPNEVITPDPDGRAWFDLLYAKLFTFTEFTRVAWGDFFKNRLNQNLLEEINTLSITELKQRYFRENADDEVVHALLASLKDDLNRFTKDKDPYKGLSVSRYSADSTWILAGAMLYYSYIQPDDFDASMGKLHPSTTHNNQTSSCGSGCSSNHDSNDNSSCGSNCGSSCGSSCGGGCGSS
jgi:hypothetical protein